MRAVLAMLFALGCVGCTETVDTSGLDPVGDYTTWRRVDTTGNIPAHLDTYRITYTNPVSGTYGGAGRYPVGSVFIKEIRKLTSDGMAGELSYIAIMRKLDKDNPPDGIDLEGGWLFTQVSDNTDIGGDEKIGNCWESCHVQAPFDGAWLNHGL